MPETAILDRGIGIAEKIGSLSTSAVLVLLVLAMGYYIYRKHKDDAQETLKRLEAWEAATKAEERQTAVITKSVESIAMMTQGHNMLAEKVMQVLTILDERLPRKKD